MQMASVEILNVTIDELFERAIDELRAAQEAWDRAHPQEVEA
jgi:hypothetical protein